MAQTIKLVRGTTNTLRISVLDANGAPYNLGSGEKVVLGVKKDPADTELQLIKTAEILGEGIFAVKLCPEDTDCMEAGRYWYDVGIDNGTDFFNVIEPSVFLLTANVTARGCADGGN